jgi:hypothetical protein
MNKPYENNIAFLTLSRREENEGESVNSKTRIQEIKDSHFFQLYALNSD